MNFKDMQEQALTHRWPITWGPTIQLGSNKCCCNMLLLRRRLVVLLLPLLLEICILLEDSQEQLRSVVYRASSHTHATSALKNRKRGNALPVYRDSWTVTRDQWLVVWLACSANIRIWHLNRNWNWNRVIGVTDFELRAGVKARGMSAPYVA